MPRPLIVKVVEHKPSPQKVVTGSIDIALLQESNKTNLYGMYNHETDYASVVDSEAFINSAEETESGSLVRSLINRYETSRTKSSLTKHKSKSLSDLLKPESFSVAKKINQEDSAMNRRSTGALDQPFDFRRVLSKFETSGSKTTSVASQLNYKARSYKNVEINTHLPHDIKQTAKVLLHTYEEHRYDPSALASWQQEVVGLLQKINSVSDQINAEQNSYKENLKETNQMTQNVTEENRVQKTKNLENGEFGSKATKVKDIKSIFESKGDDRGSLSRSVSAFYFTGKPDKDPKPTYHKQKSESLRSVFTNATEGKRYGDNDILHDMEQRHRITTNPVMSSSRKIQELKYFFESNNLTDNKYEPYEDYISRNGEDGHLDDSLSRGNQEMQETMLPPPKIVTLDDNEDVDNGIETSKQQIEELTKEIEEYDDRIEDLSQEDKDEGSYINEVLIRLLLKLDDVKTYGDAVILTERRKAIKFVQSCISKLREKIRGHE